MTDREMLELAAKAAGEWPSPEPFEHVIDRWNPRTNRSDAFSLMVKLGMDVDVGYTGNGTVSVLVFSDQRITYANEAGPADQAEQLTMRAITRCAAEVGRAMG